MQVNTQMHLHVGLKVNCLSLKQNEAQDEGGGGGNPFFEDVPLVE